MPFQSVDDYIAAQPESSRPVLMRLRGIIQTAVPDAEETIAYGMPTYKLHGKRFVHFAKWADHYALYAMNERVQQAFANELEGYSVDRGTVRFPVHEPLPEDLVERLVRFRASLEA